MKVFVSWSGRKSGAVAIALRDWLPQVIHALEPFVSSRDITAGSQWQTEIATQLGDTYFGIVCVTKENQTSPWLNFEAGALAKAIDASKVVPLAIDLKTSDIELPLAQFQAQPATQEGVAAIVAALNKACEGSLETRRLEKALSVWWPEFDSELKTIMQLDEGDSPKPKRRSDRELLEETLDVVRVLARRPSDAVRAERSSSHEDAPNVLDPSHPLLAELEDLASAASIDDGVSVLPSRRYRRVGVVGGRNLPDEIRGKLLDHAQLYDVGIDWLPSRRPRRSDGPESGDA